MTTAGLKSYGSHVKRAAEASARDDQMRALRHRRFKASLVDDPLGSADDISLALEIARRTKRD